MNNDSILQSIKKLLGLDESYDAFDTDLIIHINSVFATLAQMGVGSTDPVFQIQDDSALWSDFIDTDEIANVKSYMFLKVKLIFDPPMNSTITASINNQINELEVRLYTQKGGY